MAISQNAHHATSMGWVVGKRFPDLPWIIGGEKIDRAIDSVISGSPRAIAIFDVRTEDGRVIERCAIVARRNGEVAVTIYEIAGAKYRQEGELACES